MPCFLISRAAAAIVVLAGAVNGLRLAITSLTERWGMEHLLVPSRSRRRCYAFRIGCASVGRAPAGRSSRSGEQAASSRVRHVAGSSPRREDGASRGRRNSYTKFGLRRFRSRVAARIVGASEPRRFAMKATARNVTLGLVLVTLTGCGGMTVRERDTAVGAGLGAAAGAAITGDVGGAVGGGIIGGVIGNQVGRD